MTSVNFKLSELNGLTRRIVFPDLPTWNALAAKIELLFGIPIEKVSVYYADSDNDQVTLNSQEELDDFYSTFHSAGQAIKFTVQDLTTARLHRTMSQSSHNPARNTFGISAFDIEDDWQTLPIPPIAELQGLFRPTPSNDGHAHAFVEVLESDAGTARNHESFERDSVATPTVASSPNSPFVVALDKGKEKQVVDDDISSAGSVLGEDAPPKPPVHVFDFRAQNSPKASTETIPDIPHSHGAGVAEAKGSPMESAINEDDPVNPSLLPSHASISFANDITSLLTTFSNVISAHPELSEGVRNVLRNASNGVYWQAHRDAMSQAARDVAREAGVATETLRKETQEEAGRRVADALGGIFRTLSQTLSTQVNPPPSTNETAPNLSPPTLSEEPMLTTEAQGTAPDSPLPFIPETQPLPFDHWMSRGSGRWGERMSRLPHPPPFGPPRGPYGPYGPRHSPHVPVPPTPPMPGSWHGWAPPPPRPGYYPPGPPLGLHSAPPPSLPLGPDYPPPPAHHTPGAPQSPGLPQIHKPTPQELRAQVDEAKERYRAEKEKYRLEREERRKERESRMQAAAAELNAPPVVPLVSSAPARPSTPPAIAVHGRGGKPTHEVVSVHRHHTHLGHGSSSRRHHGHGYEHSDLRSRAVNRISKRLADMGFSESTHPELPDKVKAQLPADGVVRNDSEDDIVTTLLEDLLALSPKPPVASSSGIREVPGAWH